MVGANKALESMAKFDVTFYLWCYEIIFSNLISNNVPMEMNNYDVVIIAFIFNFAVRKVAAMRGCLIEKLHALWSCR